MTCVSTVAEPCSILLSFPLMLSVALSSRPTTYRVFVTTLQMTLFGEIPRGLDTGRKIYGFSQSIGHRVSAIGCSAPLTLHSNDCSSLTALLSGSPGRTTFRYDYNWLFWEITKVQLGDPTAYQLLVAHCFREGYGPGKRPGSMDRTPSCCKLCTLCSSTLALSMYTTLRLNPFKATVMTVGFGF